MTQMPATRAEWAYEQLKEKILSNEIAPGERLVVDQIARDLGISPMPVREAIRRLEAEGWVESKPYIGARVAPIRLEELEELYTIRLALEPILARTAVDKATPEVIEELEALLRQMDRAVEAGDAAMFSRLNYTFHRTLYDLSPWRELNRIVTAVWEKSARSRWIFVQTPEAMRESQSEHWGMLEALKHKDARRMEELMRQQKQRSFENFMSYLKRTLEMSELESAREGN